jgi:hypothetical protein
MNETGRRWAEQIVDGRFELGACLGASENACVFATEHDGQAAAIKLIHADRAQAKDHLSRYVHRATSAGQASSRPDRANTSRTKRSRLRGGGDLHLQRPWAALATHGFCDSNSNRMGRESLRLRFPNSGALDLRVDHATDQKRQTCHVKPYEKNHYGAE